MQWAYFEFPKCYKVTSLMRNLASPIYLKQAFKSIIQLQGCL